MSRRIVRLRRKKIPEIALDFNKKAVFYPCGCYCVGITDEHGVEVVVTGRDVTNIFMMMQTLIELEENNQ